MSVPPIPPPLEHLTTRPFSFYPPILNIEHNEWRFRRSTWSELLVLNTKENIEVWVPRRFWGEISRVDEPVMIVGLLKELEYKAGSLWPAERRVIEMPLAVGEGPRPSSPSLDRPAPVVGLRLETGAESRSVKLIGGVLAIGILACILVVSLFREGPGGTRIAYKTVVQSDLGLTGQDDYFAVVRKLGQPAEDRWRPNTGEFHFRLLAYPQRSLFIILMGPEENSARYIGALDKNWKPVDSIQLSAGKSTYSMLAQLKRF